MVFIVFYRRGLQLSFCRRSFSNKNDALNYLDNWVGTTKRPNNGSETIIKETNVPNMTAATFISAKSPGRSLQVSGSSYLLPTLRLPRDTKPTSLSNEFASFISSKGNSNNHAIKSMLEPKQPSGTNIWKVPVILDLSAFQHDGSPHYRPPSRGFLNSIVTEFNQLGISIIGLTNVQTIDNIGNEISDLGIPVLKRVGSGRTLGQSRTNGEMNNSVDLEELVQLVQKRTNASNTHSNSEDASSSIHKELEDEEQMILSTEEIENLSFRELQKKCKGFGLSAGGNTDALKERLMDYFCHANDQEFQEIDEEEDHHGEERNAIDPDPVQALPSLDGGVGVVRDPTLQSAIGNNILPKADDEMFYSSLQSSLSSSSIPPKIYNGIVRSGQQVSTDKPNQSLIILGNVSSGGEVMADGDIYVFGALRGRAVAGLAQPQPNKDGDRKDNEDGQGDGDDGGDDGGGGSRILCSIFDAELVCIGDEFTTVDSIENLGLKEGCGACISSSSKDGSLQFTPF